MPATSARFSCRSPPHRLGMARRRARGQLLNIARPTLWPAVGGPAEPRRAQSDTEAPGRLCAGLGAPDDRTPVWVKIMRIIIGTD
jgi:hypothetical protein